MKREFTVTHDESVSYINVEIDTDFTYTIGEKEYSTLDLIKESVEFWSSYTIENEIEESGHIHAWLKLLLDHCFFEKYYIEDATFLSKKIENDEGWPRVDGTMGIKITECHICQPDMDLSVYEVEEIER